MPTAARGVYGGLELSHRSLSDPSSTPLSVGNDGGQDTNVPTSLEEVVDRLLDLLLWVTATLGLVVVAGTMNRWVQKGWHPQHAVHLGVYLVLLAGLMAGRRIPRVARVGFVLVPLWINGGANLVWHGLAGTGMLFLAVVCIVAVVLSGLRITERLEAQRCMVFGDATLLQSAVLNVALNARDALPEGGTIEFRTELAEWPGGDGKERKAALPGQPSAHPGERILLHVRDTGEGMDEVTLRRVFEPFFTTKPVGQGTGMGLAAVHGTVHSHGGTVAVDSAPGRGTTLTLGLPLLDESFLRSGDGKAEGVVGGKGHVLVVDDEPMMRNIAAGLLEHIGYRVTTSGRPRAALDLYTDQHESIDLVLLDMVLPELGGAEVFAALRELNSKAKVLLFSGYAPDGDAQDLIRKGAVGFVQKPFTLAELSERVAEALRPESSPS